MANKVFGIDLGTTYSCIAHVDEYGRPAVIINADSQPTTPSVVLFDSPTDVVVGVQAKRQARIRPDDVASLVKRHMGEADWRFAAHGQEYSASAVSSQILRSLADDAARAMGAAGQRRGHHRARLLRRRGAQGHEAGRRARRAQRHRHHQRADRRGVQLRVRSGRLGRPHGARLRPRRRHVRLDRHHARRQEHQRGRDRRRPRARRRGLGRPARPVPVAEVRRGGPRGRRPARRHLRRAGPDHLGRGRQAGADRARVRGRPGGVRRRPGQRDRHQAGVRGTHQRAAGAHDRADPEGPRRGRRRRACRASTRCCWSAA